MGILDNLKSAFYGPKKTNRTEELNTHLTNAKTSLKQSFDYVTKFLETMKGYQPARRHEELYYEGVKNRLIAIRTGLSKGLSYANDKLNNELDTLNTIRTPDQLIDLLERWCKAIKLDDENAKDYILYYLRQEMWNEEKAKRGFPVPQSKELLLNYLEGSVAMMKEAKEHLNNYSALMNLPTAK